MDETREIFELEFDAQPRPILDFEPADDGSRVWRVDLDTPIDAWYPEGHQQAFTLWLRCAQFRQKRARIIQLVRQVLSANLFTTLQIVLEPKRGALAEGNPSGLSVSLLQETLAACQEPSTYLDRYYSMQPGRSNGAKRLILLLPAQMRSLMSCSWREAVDELVTLVWRTSAGNLLDETDLEVHEYAWQRASFAHSERFADAQVAIET